MINQTTRKLIITSLFSAIIFLGVYFLKFEIAPRTMVHLGNALVVISFLALGTKYSLIAASTGLAIYDLLNGYADSVIFTILESILVIVILHVTYKFLGEKLTLKSVITLGIVAATVKIVVIFIRRYITFTLISGATTALPLTLARMTNTFITSLFTAIAVPLLYMSLQSIIKQIKRF